jgi:hypothetical protein
MRSVILLTTRAAFLLILFFTGCCSDRDVKALERHGGLFIPTGEGPAANCPPVDRIWFDRRDVTDAVLAELAPSIIRLRPHSLDLDHQPLTDKSVVTLQSIARSGTKKIGVTGTNVTDEGLRQLQQTINAK